VLPDVLVHLGLRTHQEIVEVRPQAVAPPGELSAKYAIGDRGERKNVRPTVHGLPPGKRAHLLGRRVTGLA
jgi:hypothetical protein